VNKHLRALAQLARTCRIAHVTANLGDLALDGIVDRRDVERPHAVTVCHEVPGEVQAEKARST
jgi:hypothetical protein